MRTKVLIRVLAVIAVIGGVWVLLLEHRSSSNYVRKHNAFSAEILRVLETGDRFVLFSLDPTDPIFRAEPAPQLRETFHKYDVLGKTEIHDQQERAELLAALYKGIADSDGV